MKPPPLANRCARQIINGAYSCYGQLPVLTTPGAPGINRQLKNDLHLHRRGLMKCSIPAAGRARGCGNDAALPWSQRARA